MATTMRAWTPDDADSLLHVVSASDDLLRQTGHLGSNVDAVQLIESWNSQIAAGTGLIWAIAQDHVSVGYVGITSIERHHSTAWCWYWLALSARGAGLATRALATAAASAFDHGLHRLELAHRVNNPSSCAVAVGAGFVAEGIEREKLEYDGIRYDCETHARLATDVIPTVDLLAVEDFPSRLP